MGEVYRARRISEGGHRLSRCPVAGAVAQAEAIVSMAAIRKLFECELRFHGESYGWEARIFEQGELFTAHGRFVTRAMAVQWAQEMRNFFEVGSEVDAGR